MPVYLFNKWLEVEGRLRSALGVFLMLDYDGTLTHIASRPEEARLGLEAKRLLEREFVVVYCDNEILEKAAEIWRALRRRGALIEDRDLIIGATAIAKGLPLLTGNVKHFKRLREFRLRFYEQVVV